MVIFAGKLLCPGELIFRIYREEDARIRRGDMNDLIQIISNEILNKKDALFLKRTIYDVPKFYSPDPTNRWAAGTVDWREQDVRVKSLLRLSTSELDKIEIIEYTAEFHSFVDDIWEKVKSVNIPNIVGTIHMIYEENALKYPPRKAPAGYFSITKTKTFVTGNPHIKHPN